MEFGHWELMTGGERNVSKQPLFFRMDSGPPNRKGNCPDFPCALFSYDEISTTCPSDLCIKSTVCAGMASLLGQLVEVDELLGTVLHATSANPEKHEVNWRFRYIERSTK